MTNSTPRENTVKIKYFNHSTKAQLSGQMPNKIKESLEPSLSPEHYGYS